MASRDSLITLPKQLPSHTSYFWNFGLLLDAHIVELLGINKRNVTRLMRQYSVITVEGATEERLFLIS